MTTLDDYRAAKDDFFREDRDSPLFTSQRERFTGLRYFPENPALRLRVPLDRSIDLGVFEIGTSMGDRQAYYRLGRVVFEIGGVSCELYLFGREPDDRVAFVPFRDKTSGQETYGSGRYLEAEITADGHVELDFNYAYNPFCAYNENWSCPLPPMENWLLVRIEAGEMDFKT